MERSSKADCWGPARDAETGKGSRQLLAVDGLFCGGCARGLEQRLRKLEGVLDAGVHYLTASAFVHWNPRLCSLREIEACIASAPLLAALYGENCEPNNGWATFFTQKSA